MLPLSLSLLDFVHFSRILSPMSVHFNMQFCRLSVFLSIAVSLSLFHSHCFCLSLSVSLAVFLSLYDSHTHLHNSPSHLCLCSSLRTPLSSSSFSSSSSVSPCFRARASPRHGLRKVPWRDVRRSEHHVREHHRAVRGDAADSTRHMMALSLHARLPVAPRVRCHYGQSRLFCIFLSGVSGCNVACVCILFVLRIVYFCLLARFASAVLVFFFVWHFKESLS